MHTVYLITNHTTGKYYVGQTVRSLVKRWQSHIASSRQPKWPIHRSILKHGVNAFSVEVLATALNQTDANWYECYFIEQYKSMCFRNGYNVRSGGSHGNPFAGKTNGEMQEISAKRSAAISGEKHHFWGRRGPNLGKQLSETTRIKIGEANKGRRHTAEARAIMSAQRQGEANGAAKLTADQVAGIRMLRAQGTKIGTLSNKFGVSMSQVKRIIYNKAWRD